MSKIDSAVSWATKVAADNSHGYSQINRWGPDYDCSSLVISAYQQAGVPVKDKGATYTANMYNAFIKAGFKDVTSSINMQTGSGLKKGDVLLNHRDHTAMMTSSKTLVQASIDENGQIWGTRKGDQTGYEIFTRSYYNYPWDCVLRYPEVTTTTNKSKTSTSATKSTATKTTKKTYTVVKGDTLSAIAKKYGVTVDAIVKENKIANPNVIKVGQKFTIPAAKSYTKGTKITLKKTPVFASSTAANYSVALTGTYYIYDGKTTNGRLRITNRKDNCGRAPVSVYVSGWVRKSDI